MFTTLKRDENGQLIEVAVADTREQKKLFERMRRLFPGDEYELRESEPKAPEAAE